MLEHACMRMARKWCRDVGHGAAFLIQQANASRRPTCAARHLTELQGREEEVVARKDHRAAGHVDAESQRPCGNDEAQVARSEQDLHRLAVALRQSTVVDADTMT